MSVGSSKWTITAGGGQVRATSQQIARAVVHLGISPLLTPNVLTPVSSDTGSILSKMDYCSLAEACAFTGRSGLIKYAVALNPSTAGALRRLARILSGTEPVR